MALLDLIRTRDSIADAIMNLHLGRGISPDIRKRVTTPERLAYIINDAVNRFCIQARPSSLSELFAEITLDSHPDLPGDDHLSYYKIPETVLTERADAGVVYVILNNDAFEVREAVTLYSLRDMVTSVFYGKSHRAFHLNFETRTLAAGSEVNVRIRAIKKPTEVTSSDFTAVEPPDLPLSSEYLPVITQMGVQSAISLIHNISEAEQQQQQQEDVDQQVGQMEARPQQLDQARRQV